jgi:hypothetical protein
MSEIALESYIQLYPGIRGFIFTPPATGESRTWIFSATEPPEFVLNFHFAALLTQGWHVLESSPRIIAERDGSNISISASRQKEETRIVYEVYSGPRKDWAP